MTVKDFVAVVEKPSKLTIVWEGSLEQFDPDSVLHMSAYGDYKVASIGAFPDHDEPNVMLYEIGIAMEPIKERG